LGLQEDFNGKERSMTMEPRIGKKLLSELQVGDVFYERHLRLEVVDVPTKTWSETLEAFKWQWKAKTEDGREIEYLITEGHEHYGPQLSDYPAYVFFQPESFETKEAQQ
jgi:hypothetical protein